MKTFGFKSGALLAGVLATTLVAGCAGIPQDDRYQIHDGGRSNTRAEVPATSLMAGGAPLQWRVFVDT